MEKINYKDERQEARANPRRHASLYTEKERSAPCVTNDVSNRKSPGVSFAFRNIPDSLSLFVQYSTTELLR